MKATVRSLAAMMGLAVVASATPAGNTNGATMPEAHKAGRTKQHYVSVDEIFESLKGQTFRPRRNASFFPSSDAARAPDGMHLATIGRQKAKVAITSYGVIGWAEAMQRGMDVPGVGPR